MKLPSSACKSRSCRTEIIFLSIMQNRFWKTDLTGSVVKISFFRFRRMLNFWGIEYNGGTLFEIEIVEVSSVRALFNQISAAFTVYSLVSSFNSHGGTSTEFTHFIISDSCFSAHLSSWYNTLKMRNCTLKTLKITLSKKY